MSAEPLAGPSDMEGTTAGAAPVASTTVVPETAVQNGSMTASTEGTQDPVVVDVHAAPRGVLNKQEVEDPDYDPDAVGDFEYAPMPPQECCGCRPSLSKCCYKRRMGRAYICYERTGDRPKIFCMCGAGWTTQIVTIVLVFGISGGAYGFSLRVLHWGFTIGAVVVLGLTGLAVCAVGCSNPGIFPRYTKKKEPHWRLCQQSNSYRPPGVQWCSETGALITDVDHFCPWSGTTIAEGNKAWFHMFLAMVCVSLAYVVICIIAAAISQGSTATWPIT